MSGDKRPLSHVGGEVETSGDPVWASPLAKAMAAQQGDILRLTHALHPYPARMDPALAASILSAYGGRRGSKVLDPFCGGGTVLVEGVAAGWRALGSDLDPLAIRLTRQKARLTTQGERKAFVELLHRVGQASQERVQARSDARAPLGPQMRQLYEIHVLKELAGLLDEIRGRGREEEEGRWEEALEMVFSALLIKFSKQRSETSRKQESRRIRKGLVSEFFVRKGEELARGWEQLNDRKGPKRHRAKLLHADVRKLPQVIGGEYRAHLILSSPPYGGTYDYADHHALRHAWLGLDAKRLRKHEMGARRDYAKDESRDPRDSQERGPERGKRRRGDAQKHKSASSGDRAARDRWHSELAAMLASCASLVSESGAVVLLMGDSRIQGRTHDAAEELARLAPKQGLELVASASQARPDFAGGKTRREHLMTLLPVD